MTVNSPVWRKEIVIEKVIIYQMKANFMTDITVPFMYMFEYNFQDIIFISIVLWLK